MKFKINIFKSLRLKRQLKSDLTNHSQAKLRSLLFLIIIKLSISKSLLNPQKLNFNLICWNLFTVDSQNKLLKILAIKV